MCGIVGVVGARSATDFILEGLNRLEYRGYDSAGIAVLDPEGLVVHKIEGRVRDLAGTLPPGLTGRTAIGHTRWATHGRPSAVNAHPHLDGAGRVAIVHNGIVENAAGLRDELRAAGVRLRSETDSEVLAHLIARSSGLELADRVGAALEQVEGACALAVLDRDHPGLLLAARRGSPLVIGIGPDGHFVASDPMALAEFASEVVEMEDGDVAELSSDRFALSRSGRPIVLTPKALEIRQPHPELTGFDHYMEKEIHEQPMSLARTLRDRLSQARATADLEEIGMASRDLARVERVKILGCGSAFYSGLSGAQMIEELARIPASAESAAEFRYREPVVEPTTLYVVVSQSGETIDTLQAARMVKAGGAQVVAVVNSQGSTIDREVGRTLLLHAGPEVSVASTKTFTSTLVAFGLLALGLARAKGMGRAEGDRLVDGLRQLPEQAADALVSGPDLVQIAHRLSEADSAYFVGRVRGYPVALEGAQKLKEISYLHAEAYPCAELKHGPLSLICPEMPTIAVIPNDDLIAKNLVTLEEVRARGGPIVAVGHASALKDAADCAVLFPAGEPELDPVLLSIPLQRLAYLTAVARGLDVDRPRNLAKSVTVE